MNTSYQDKWNRLNNPKTIEDYGLSLTEKELRTFPEGRIILFDIKVNLRKEKQLNNKLNKLKLNMQQTIENLIIQVLNSNK